MTRPDDATAIAIAERAIAAVLADLERQTFRTVSQLVMSSGAVRILDGETGPRVVVRLERRAGEGWPE